MPLFSDFELRENNLYVNGKVIEFTAQKEAALVRERIKYAGKEGDVYHVVLDGEELTGLAGRYFGDQVADAGKYWWVIADVNFIYNPLDISDLVGTEILIPDILSIKLNLSVIQ